jgi:hypothetical protein
MTNFLDKTISEIFAKRSKKGQLGIEVEVEGKGLPDVINGNWSVHLDGSLRGEAKEYVFIEPLNQEEAYEQVNILYKALEGKVNNSMRAGVHVHLNCLHLTVRELFTVMAAYYCIENLLTEDAGEEREGNLFCLRLCDADYINTGILNCLYQQDLVGNNGIFYNENLRYAAMNLVSISKFGSLEFRALRTPLEGEKVIEWADTLQTLKDNTLKHFKTPMELLTAMSANGGEEVVTKLLGKYAKKQIAKPNFEASLYESIRSIQHWVFLTNWEKK